jgi:hypothetical protein
LSAAPAAEWEIVNPKLPTGMAGWESDTGKIKIGNGVSSWNTLSYAIESVILEEYITKLSNANLPNGVAVLTEDGILPLDILPPQSKEHVTYVANIESRDNIPIENRNGIVVVIDATGDIIKIEDAIEHTFYNVYDKAAEDIDGGGAVIVDFGTILGVNPEDFENTTPADITVTRGGAVYVWNGNSTNGTWLKISEFESMDIDFSVYLETLKANLDIIADGVNFIKFTLVEKYKLEITINMDDVYIYKGMAPNKIKTL